MLVGYFRLITSLFSEEKDIKNNFFIVLDFFECGNRKYHSNNSTINRLFGFLKQVK